MGLFGKLGALSSRLSSLINWHQCLSIFHTDQRGVSLKRVVVAILLAFVGFIFIIKFVPTIESVSTANITNDFTKTIADIGIWLLPVGGLIGVFYGVFKLFGGGGKGGD